MVQILRSSTSKSVPNMQRGAFLSQKPLSRHSAAQILRSSVFNDFDSKSRATARCIFYLHLGQPILRNSRFCELILRAFEATKLWKLASFRAIPTRQTLSCCVSVPVSHFCSLTSMLQDLAAPVSIVGS